MKWEFDPPFKNDDSQSTTPALQAMIAIEAVAR
jgi:hypothetical protein